MTNIQFQEVQPEVIDPNKSPAPAPELVPAPAPKPTPEPETPPEQATEAPNAEELEKLRTSLTDQVNTLVDGLKAISLGEHQQIGSLQKTISEKDDSAKSTSETHKKVIKETVVKHKGELKAKDKEITDLKKLIAKKEKEVNNLHKQVKAALYGN